MLDKGSNKFENHQAKKKNLSRKDSVQVSHNILLELKKKKKKEKGKKKLCLDGVNYNLGTWKTEAGLCAQGHPQLHRQLQASLCYAACPSQNKTKPENLQVHNKERKTKKHVNSASS